MINKEMEREWALFYKYRHGGNADPKDLPLIEGLCLVGLMNKGLSLKRKVITAKTTKQGMDLLPLWYPLYPLKALGDYLRLSWHHFRHRNSAISRRSEY